MNIPQYIRNKIYSLFSNENVFFSQEGEDVILRTIFPKKHNGFYVDVGAHDPYYLSNTCYFYLKGWNGINIDVNPSTLGKFKKARSRDVNLECAVGLSNKKHFYYMFDKPEVDTLSEPIAHELISNRKHKVKLLRKVPMRTVSLKSILSKYLKKKQSIDFLSVDVEGSELEVLKSNDWHLFRPEILLVEQHGFDALNRSGSRISNYLKTKKYRLFAKTISTVFYRNCQ
jgi:FkbM family methyltransferase